MPTSGLDEANGVRPMEAGVVTDWEAMETYWDHAFTHHLRINTEHCGVVLTANLWETKLNKERIAQSLFESFAVPAIYLCSPPVFELYAAGRENGVVLGSGADCTYAVMVHEGLPDPRTLLRGSVAGTVLTTHAASVLAGVTGGALDAEAAEAAKIAVGCVAGAPSSASDVPMSYTLPDGKTIEVPLATRIALTEPLFDPSILRSAAAKGGASSSGTPAARVGKGDVESCGLSRLVAECIRLRDRDGVLESPAIAKDRAAAWYGSVVLGGGSTCFAGIEDRLNAELRQFAPKGSPPVRADPAPARPPIG